ncbi:MAG: RdgB/HAM1 family non-canonical purine NTP pyrophosphatase [Leptospiraceae bacterium]|nr:RdgB/HAM1 family non-canonical purine NTP pyrophosphatase [Leptospiraceae bacterium]
MKEILLSSNNQHKIHEFGNALDSIGWKLLTPKDLGLSFEVEETGKTFDENASLKSNHLFQLTGKPSLADDSGLCVDVLDGAPGIYSARFGGEGLSDRDRALLLLRETSNFSDRNCHYFASLAYTTEEGTKFFHGKCEGLLEKEYDFEGKFGFGYDPVFYYPPLKERFSRVPLEEKNKVSHRANALKLFVEYLKQS